jgi:hypothetical protein
MTDEKGGCDRDCVLPRQQAPVRVEFTARFSLDSSLSSRPSCSSSPHFCLPPLFYLVPRSVHLLRLRRGTFSRPLRRARACLSSAPSAPASVDRFVSFSSISDLLLHLRLIFIRAPRKFRQKKSHEVLPRRSTGLRLGCLCCRDSWYLLHAREPCICRRGFSGNRSAFFGLQCPRIGRVHSLGGYVNAVNGTNSDTRSRGIIWAATEEMPYWHMTQGGYQQMGCGYGYYKDMQGYCQPESWVCPILIFHFDLVVDLCRYNAVQSRRRMLRDHHH